MEIKKVVEVIGEFNGKSLSITVLQNFQKNSTLSDFRNCVNDVIHNSASLCS